MGTTEASGHLYHSILNNLEVDELNSEYDVPDPDVYDTVGLNQKHKQPPPSSIKKAGG
jgi:hypothetical protein